MVSVRSRAKACALSVLAAGIAVLCPSVAGLPVLALGHSPISDNRVDAQTLNLITVLSTHPELMNVDYLRYIIGLPDNYNQMRYFSQKSFHWYSINPRRLLFSLEQRESGRGQVVESHFFAYLDNGALDFKQVHEMYSNQTARRFFDNRCLPTEEYAVAPNTFARFSQEPNLFGIRHMSVYYLGSPLPKPSPEAMATAMSMRRNRALMHHTSGHDREAIPVLMEHIAENPGDMETHLALAQAYKKQGHLNSAISEYRLLLSCPQIDQNTRNRCLADLVEMHVLPKDKAEAQSIAEQHIHHYELVNGGQGLRAGRLRSKRPPRGAARLAQQQSLPVLQSIQQSPPVPQRWSPPLQVANTSSYNQQEPF